MSSGETQPLLRGDSPLYTEIRHTTKSNMGTVEKAKTYAANYAKNCCTVESWKRRLPIMTWIPKYRLPDLQCDLIAGFTVALTVMPQGLAYAKIAGLPPQYGLYSAFMGCFLYTFLGTSKDITLGPTAIMSLMTAAFATSPVEGDPTYAIIMCLMCGVVQFVMGLFNLGILVNFISYPVINAFTSAAAITIAVGQLKGILGLHDIPREFLHMVYETCAKIPETNVWDLIMGLVCLVILFGLKKLRTIKWKDDDNAPPPGICVRICRYIIWLVGTASNAIVVVSASGVSAILLSQNVDKLTITGHLQPGLPPVRIPDFSINTLNVTRTTTEIFSDIGAGFIIVPLLGLVELIAIGKAFARQNNYKIKPTQELIAVGIANMVSCLVSSYPVTGSFSRTAVNSQSGVRTPASGLVTGALMLLALQVLTPLFYYIPISSLSAVIISAVLQMVDYRIVKRLWKSNKIDLIPFTITFLTSFLVGIEYGIIIGIGISLLMLLYPMARPANKAHNLGVVVVTLESGLRFPSIEYVQQKVMQAAQTDSKTRSVVLDCSKVSGIDYSTMMGILELIADLKRKDAQIVFAALPKKILEHLHQGEIPGLLVSSTIEEGCKLLEDELKPLAENEDGIKRDYRHPNTIIIDVTGNNHTLPDGSITIDASNHTLPDGTRL